MRRFAGPPGKSLIIQPNTLSTTYKNDDAMCFRSIKTNLYTKLRRRHTEKDLIFKVSALSTNICFELKTSYEPWKQKAAFIASHLIPQQPLVTQKHSCCNLVGKSIDFFSGYNENSLIASHRLKAFFPVTNQENQLTAL